jgi:hypothetical protein
MATSKGELFYANDVPTFINLYSQVFEGIIQQNQKNKQSLLFLNGQKMQLVGPQRQSIADMPTKRQALSRKSGLERHAAFL